MTRRYFSPQCLDPPHIRTVYSNSLFANLNARKHLRDDLAVSASDISTTQLHNMPAGPLRFALPKASGGVHFDTSGAESSPEQADNDNPYLHETVSRLLLIPSLLTYDSYGDTLNVDHGAARGRGRDQRHLRRGMNDIYAVSGRRRRTDSHVYTYTHKYI